VGDSYGIRNRAPEQEHRDAVGPQEVSPAKSFSPLFAIAVAKRVSAGDGTDGAVVAVNILPVLVRSWQGMAAAAECVSFCPSACHACRGIAGLTMR
jgi:hypothetical protein